MDKQTILASLTPEVVDKFRMAIELGKWPDGRKLTAEQRETCMQAVMVWEHEHLHLLSAQAIFISQSKTMVLSSGQNVMLSMSIIIQTCLIRKAQSNRLSFVINRLMAKFSDKK